MKKVIAILAVMIVLVGAVFAAETHTIKVKTVVDEVLPVFQMTIGQVTTNTENGGAQFEAGPYAPSVAAVADDPATLDVDETVAEANIGDSWSFEQAHNVTISVKINNEAKTVHIYQLTFSDGQFTVNKAKVPTTINPKSITADVGSSNDPGFGTTASGAVATVTFSGTTCTQGSEVATAVFAYDQDKTVDPGVYYADIVLSIVTD